LISHAWHRWCVRDNDGHDAVQFQTGSGYSCIQGADFYAYALDQIARHPTVTLRLAETLLDYAEDKHGVAVRTDRGSYRAKFLFDGASPLPAPRRHDVSLRQRFFGQHVQAGRPVFDTSQATLMDFGVERTPNALHFMYVLPFSPTQALIENTFVGPDCAVSTDTHRCQIADYAQKRWGVTEYAVVREEGGNLPMTTQPFPLRRGRRVFHIGTLAGSVKPSSGYAFARIGEHARHLAVAFASGRLDTVPRQIAPPKFAFLDTVFLAALERHPERFPAAFYTLFSRVPAARLTRFLSETSTWQDDLSVLRVLPQGTFLRAAMRSLPLWLPRLLPIRPVPLP
jgi:lycopene beta-cyclase